MSVSEAEMNTRHEHITSRRDLEVGIQNPEGNNLAAKMGEPQVAVVNGTGMVIAFCGPVNQEGLDDAALFAAAPHLYEALTKVYGVLGGIHGSAAVDEARELLEKAVGKAHVHPRVERVAS